MAYEAEDELPDTMEEVRAKFKATSMLRKRKNPSVTKLLSPLGHADLDTTRVSASPDQHAVTTTHVHIHVHVHVHLLLLLSLFRVMLLT